MSTWQDIFSRASILDQLCRRRLKLAGKREAERLLDGSDAGRTPKSDPVAKLFPPRKVWARFRPKRRRGVPSAAVARQTLLRAVEVLSVERPKDDWVQALRQTIERIQERALDDPHFHFGAPRIVAVPKEPGGRACRPLCQFGLEDGIICSLASRYYRQFFDTVFHPSCLAFRSGNLSPNRDRGVESLLQFRARHGNAPLFVAELDVRAFFDCVDHSVALDCLHHLTAQATRQHPELVVSPRAGLVLASYLDCYSFPRAQAITPDQPEGKFAWPQAALAALHPDLDSARLGIPQGGALSNLLANVILHQVDDRMAALLPDPTKACYLRYCDDILLVAADPGQCSAALQTCLEILKTELRLPVHPPVSVEKYGAKFWRTKSRLVYRWVAPQQVADVPWVQFLGYQIRHDGVLRIAKQSLERHRERLRTEADRVLNVPGRPHWKFGKFLNRVARRLVNLSVGRNGARRPWPARCWVDGFQLLQGRLQFPGPLKALDHLREKHLHRIRRAGAAGGWPAASKMHRGFSFSYLARFVGLSRSKE